MIPKYTLHVKPVFCFSVFSSSKTNKMSWSMKKLTKWLVRRANTQICLGAKDPMLLHANSEYSDHAQSDLSLRKAHSSFCWFRRAVAQIFTFPCLREALFQTFVQFSIPLAVFCGISLSNWHHFQKCIINYVLNIRIQQLRTLPVYSDSLLKPWRFIFRIYKYDK